MEIRIVAAPSELHQCLAIRHAVFTVEKKVPEEIEVDESDCLNGMCDHILIQNAKVDIGALRCVHVDSETMKIQRFCLLQKYRGQGLAREALRLIEDYYRWSGKIKILLDSKFQVSGFYEKCGYKRVSGIFEEAGIPHVKMMKNI